MLYDTLKMARRLEADFTVEQARTLTEAIAESTAETVATKTDIALLKSDLTLLKGDLEAAKVALGAEIVASAGRLIKWIVAALAFNLFGTAGLVLSLLKITR